MSDLQVKGAGFAQKIFDDIREMSRDVLGVTRQGYSVKETEVHNYLRTIGESLNLEIVTDRAGNLWMTLPGEDRSLPAFVSGSHADSVPQGGNYDGLAGVVAALTVAWYMRETNYMPKRDYTVLVMRCEESSFFGKAYVGSLGMFGQLTEKDINFCCLVKINMNLQSLANIYCISGNSVSRRKLRLKEKLGIDKDESLSKFLSRFA